MSMPQKYKRLTWTDVDRIIDMLMPQIESVGPFQAMVMITRGGVIPGGLLAEALDIQHLLTAAVDFPSSEKGKMMTWPKFLQFPVDELLQDRRTLIIDDVWGSGRTSTAVSERVSAAGAIAHTCVLHFNPYRTLFSKAKPDFYGEVTDAYIVYPWEIDRGSDFIGEWNPTPEPQIN